MFAYLNLSHKMRPVDHMILFDNFLIKMKKSTSVFTTDGHRVQFPYHYRIRKRTVLGSGTKQPIDN